MTDELRDEIRELTARVEARLRDPAYQARVAELEAEWQRDLLNQRRWGRKYLGIPASFERALDALHESEALAAVRAFLLSDKRVLLLCGDVGRGKSLAAAWAVEEERGRFVEAADVVQANVYDPAAWRGFFTPGLLAIDELGMEPLDQGGWGESKLYDLLNGRIQALKKTILVTNLDGRAFFARYPDKRLRDRLRAYGQYLSTKGESMRAGRP